MRKQISTIIGVLVIIFILSIVVVIILWYNKNMSDIINIQSYNNTYSKKEMSINEKEDDVDNDDLKAIKEEDFFNC